VDFFWSINSHLIAICVASCARSRSLIRGLLLFEVSGYRIFASYEPPPSTLARMTLDKTELLFSYHTLTLSFGLLVDLHSAINTLWSIKNGSFYMKKLLLTVIFISGCSSIASKDLGNAGTPQATFGCTEESFQTSVARIFTDVLQCKTQLLANPSAPGNRNRLTTSPISANLSP